jgi:uncharacterized protein
MIQRRQFTKIQNHLTEREITVLIGARQVGKTTLMGMLRTEIQTQARPHIWLNLDVEVDMRRMASQAVLLAHIELEVGNNPCVVFIDEIQRKTDAGKFLKGIYDTRPDLKFVISGSGSLELKEKIVESLAGRKRLFEISPLTYEEFIDYRTAYKYSDKLANWCAANHEQAEIYLEEYLQFGGYPKVVLTSEKTAKTAYLQEVIDSYLLRDITELIPKTKISLYSILMHLVALQAGYPIKYDALSQHVQLSAPTVKDYLWYMEHTFYVRKSVPYFTNPLQEIVKEPCFYFSDLGVLAYQRNGNQPEIGAPKGFVFQNFVFNELYHAAKGTSGKLKYWRTKDRAEVDIVLEKGSILVPIEVKYAKLKSGVVTRSLASFIERYQPPTAYVICLEGDYQLQRGSTLVHFIPYYKMSQIFQSEETSNS